MFYYNLVTCRCIPYTCIILIAEVNSIFLHARKLMQMCKIPFDHWIYRTNVYINLVTFVLCRFTGMTKIWHAMMTEDGYRVSNTYYALLCISNPAVSIINVILFWRLLKNDILRSSQSKSRKTKVPVLNNNVNGNTDLTQNGFDKKSL